MNDSKVHENYSEVLVNYSEVHENYSEVLVNESEVKNLPKTNDIKDDK